MTSHSHDLEDWPFADADNTAVFTCRHVLEGMPILCVTHDEDDGAWQLLCGQLHDSDDAKLVCLGCMVTGDKTLLQLADLPLGALAARERVGAAWARDGLVAESDP